MQIEQQYEHLICLASLDRESLEATILKHNTPSGFVSRRINFFRPTFQTARPFRGHTTVKLLVDASRKKNSFGGFIAGAKTNVSKMRLSENF